MRFKSIDYRIHSLFLGALEGVKLFASEDQIRSVRQLGPVYQEVHYQIYLCFLDIVW